MIFQQGFLKKILQLKNPLKDQNETSINSFVFDLEDKISSICKTYSLKNSNQERN